MKSIVTARDLSFETPNGRCLFENLNLSLEPKLTALVGPNGIGKTCLAKLLAGELEPTGGSIRRNASITFFAQRLPPPSISVDEYLASDYSWSPLGEKLLQGIDRPMPCNQLSGGQWMRVRLALKLDSQFLILDEPTNDLDREGRLALIEFLRDYQSGVLLISHDRECLELCEDILELSNRGLCKFSGGWKAYEKSKDDERDRLKNNLDSAKRKRDSARLHRSEEISKQEKRNSRGQKAAERGGLPKILLGARKRRAQATTGEIDSSTLAQSNEAVREAYEAFQDLKIDPVMYADLMGQQIPSQKLIAEARDFNIAFQNWIYLEDLNFSWRGNLRLALKGSNGSGKSTLLKALLGAPFQIRGELRRGQLHSLYIDQQCSNLMESKSIFDNIRDVSTASESEIRNNLAKFLFMKDSVFQEVHTLSGGERLRAALAKGLLSQAKPELLILDEPTNNLDLANIEFLESLIQKFRGALIVISHDEVFLNHCQLTEEFLIKGQ